MLWPAGLAAVTLLVTRVPTVASQRTCHGDLDDPVAACRHLVGMGVFLAIYGAMYVPLLIAQLRRGPRSLPLPRPGWQESFTAVSDCPTAQPDQGPSDCAASRE